MPWRRNLEFTDRASVVERGKNFVAQTAVVFRKTDIGRDRIGAVVAIGGLNMCRTCDFRSPARGR